MLQDGLIGLRGGRSLNKTLEAAAGGKTGDEKESQHVLIKLKL